MNFSEYQELAAKTNVTSKDASGQNILLLGLFGEAGSLLSALKKHLREKKSFQGYQAVFEEELGDCLWYVSNVCLNNGLKLDALAKEIAHETCGYDSSADTPITLDELETNIANQGIIPAAGLENELLRLGAVAGQILNIAGDNNLDHDQFRLALKRILLALIQAAIIGKISLSDAAQRNIAKNNSRWPGEDKQYPKLFDEGMPDIEQLPRKLEIEFHHYQQGKNSFVIQRCNGINIGNRLTDNRMEPDYYRYHDVFHLAYATHLGWSPVLRALFRLKRKSNPQIDETQDGARAIIMEEGISTWIFHRSAGLNFYDGLDAVDYSLLKSIQDFVKGYEVEACRLWQWECAILEGFRIFRELRVHQQGIVSADLNHHTLNFRPL